MKIKVWDFPTRLFHWLLVICIAFLIFSGKSGNLFDWHQTAGIIVLALVLYRLVWGLFGSTTARFSHFLYSPSKVIAYAKTLFNRESEKHAGHNPMGGLMVFAMLAVLLFEGVTGLFSTDEVLVEGPLYELVDSDTADWLTGLHHSSSEILIPLIVLHILAIIFYRIYKKQDLIKPMITGDAELPEVKQSSIKIVPAVYGIVLMVVCYLALYYGLPLLVAS